MGVTFELIDAPYPYLCAVYRCACGGAATSYGAESAEPPPGWVQLGESDVVCPGCAERMRERALDEPDAGQPTEG